MTDLCIAPKPAFGIKEKYSHETTITHDQPYHVCIYLEKRTRCWIFQVSTLFEYLKKPSLDQIIPINPLDTEVLCSTKHYNCL